MSCSSGLNLKKGNALMLCRFRIANAIQVPEPYKEVLSCDDIFQPWPKFFDSQNSQVGYKVGSSPMEGHG